MMDKIPKKQREASSLKLSFEKASDGDIFKDSLKSEDCSLILKFVAMILLQILKSIKKFLVSIIILMSVKNNSDFLIQMAILCLTMLKVFVSLRKD